MRVQFPLDRLPSAPARLEDGGLITAYNTAAVRKVAGTYNPTNETTDKTARRAKHCRPADQRTHEGPSASALRGFRAGEFFSWFAAEVSDGISTAACGSGNGSEFAGSEFSA